MKYIKLYSELNESVVDPIKEYVENSLAYLFDDGYRYNITSERSITTSQRPCDLISIEVSNTETFNWDDIKDDYIPFLMDIKRKYLIVSNRDGEKVEMKLVVIFDGEERGEYSFGLDIDKVIEDDIDSYSKDFGDRSYSPAKIKSIKIMIQVVV